MCAMTVEQTFEIHPELIVAHEAAERLFSRVATRLRELLPASADIRHIGATAIPGCLTKGDLDIVARVEQQDFAWSDQALANDFSRNTGSVRTDSFSAFEDATTSPHLGIQLTAVGGPYDFFHLFVDVLNQDPSLVASYNELKSRFNGRPMSEYREAKDNFVVEVLAKRSRPS